MSLTRLPTPSVKMTALGVWGSHPEPPVKNQLPTFSEDGSFSAIAGRNQVAPPSGDVQLFAGPNHVHDPAPAVNWIASVVSLVAPNGKKGTSPSLATLIAGDAVGIAVTIPLAPSAK